MTLLLSKTTRTVRFLAPLPKRASRKQLLPTHPRFLLIQTAFIGDVILATPLIEKLAAAYPEAEIDVFGFSLHWLIVFFVLSIVFAFSLKGVFGVTI